MNWDDILELLEQGEGQTVEFEKQVPSDDDLAREMVGFANTTGGKMIIGLDDKNKHLIGAVIGDDFEDHVIELGKKHCTPLITPTVKIVNKSNHAIVIITIPEGEEKPYRTDDIVYIRDGNSSRPAKETEEKEITSPWSGHGLNKRQLSAMQMITEHGSITNREFREAFSVSHKTAHIELTMLADKKLVLTQGSGRSTCYVLPNRTEEL